MTDKLLSCARRDARPQGLAGLAVGLALLMLLACTPTGGSPAVPPKATPPAGKESAPPAAGQPSAGDNQQVANFYRGKTFKIIVGYAAGGGYDAYSRLLARRLREYIPGNPTVIVENRPGAGGLIAANYIGSLAPKDGTEMAHFDPYLILHDRAGKPGVEFKSTELNWIGNPTPDEQVCILRADTGLDSVAAIRQSGRQVNMGSTGVGSVVYAIPAAVNETVASVFNIISGYGGTSNIRLAIENNELEGACWGWTSIRSTAAAWLEGPRPFVNSIVQTGRQRQPDLPNVPTLRELVVQRDKMFIVDVIDSLASVDRVYAMPGGVPPERVAAVREAFVKAWADPQVQEEAQRTQLQVQANDYRAVEEAVKTIMALSDEQIRQLSTVLGIQ